MDENRDGNAETCGLDAEYARVLARYGLRHQRIKLIEEAHELDDAVDLWMQDPTDERKFEVAKEIADVLNMAGQMRVACGVDGRDIERIMRAKIGRQLNRMESEGGAI